MKKKIGIAFMVCLCFGLIKSTFAQQTKITWSPELFSKKPGMWMPTGSILYDDGTNVYLSFDYAKVWEGEAEPSIVKLDENMQPVVTEKYIIKSKDGNGLPLMGVFYCKGKFVLLSKEYNKEINKLTIYGTLVDKSTLKPIKEMVELWKVSANKKQDIITDFRVSGDTNSFVVTANFNLGDEENKQLAFKVFDSDFNVKNEKNTTLKYTEEKYKFLEFVLNNDGTMLYLGKSYVGKANKEYRMSEANTKISNYNLSIYKFGIDGKENETIVDMGKNIIGSIFGVSDPISTDFLIFWTTINVEDKVLHEYQFIKVNSSTGDIISKKAHGFSPKVVSRISEIELFPLGYNQKGNSIPFTFKIRSIEACKDGRTYFILQNEYKLNGDNPTMQNPSGSNSQSEYFTNGVIVSLLDKDGNLDWMNYIPKAQYSTNTSYMNVNMVYHEDKLQIYYNDNMKNIQYDINNSLNRPKIFDSAKEMSFIVVDIKNDGKMTRREITNSEEQGHPVVIINSISTSPKRYILYGQEFKSVSTKIGLMKL